MILNNGTELIGDIVYRTIKRNMIDEKIAVIIIDKNNYTVDKLIDLMKNIQYVTTQNDDILTQWNFIGLDDVMERNDKFEIWMRLFSIDTRQLLTGEMDKIKQRQDEQDRAMISIMDTIIKGGMRYV